MRRSLARCAAGPCVAWLLTVVAAPSLADDAGEPAVVDEATLPAPEPAPEPADDAEPPQPPAPSPPPPAPAESPELERAKELHRRGLALLRAGDVERALDYFQRSRAVFPSAPNVTNVAICLERLERFDEALEAYEVLLTDHADALAAEDRAAIAPAMLRLRGKVASLWITASEAGSVLVDGRERGKLPLAVPLRVLGGKHVVRIQKPGFEPWEQTVTAAVGETVTLDARLVALANVGILRIESSEVASVIVDGADVGQTPWEGPLSPGRHLVWLRAGERGSAPQELILVEGQIVLARPALVALGPEVRLAVTPATAAIFIDDLRLGTGTWTGRLTEGEHLLRVSERGYVEQRRTLVASPGAAPEQLSVRLAVDHEHPRWPRPVAPGQVWVDALVGYAGSHTMGAGAEASCPAQCTGDPVTHGVMGALRVGYRFPPQLSIELGVGYAFFGTALRRLYREPFAGGEHLVSYQLDDRPLVRGPFLAPGLGYRYRVTDWLALEGRAALGILFAAASNDVTAVVATTGAVVDAGVAQRDLQRTVTIFVMPSLGAELTFGAVSVGAGLGAAMFPLEGPALANGPLFARASPDPAERGAVGNAPASDAIAGERAWGPLVLWVPHLRGGYAF